MTTTYADLWARLAPLAAAATVPSWATAQTFTEENRAFIVALVNLYPDIDALLARGEAAEADADRAEADADRLTVIVGTPYPVGAYVRWSRNGNTDDADALNHYEEDRDAALRRHVEALALRERPS